MARRKHTLRKVRSKNHRLSTWERLSRGLIATSAQVAWEGTINLRQRQQVLLREGASTPFSVPKMDKNPTIRRFSSSGKDIATKFFLWASSCLEKGKG